MSEETATKEIKEELKKEIKSELIDDEIETKKKHLKALEKDIQDKLAKSDKIQANTDEIRARMQEWDYNVHCSETKDIILIKIFKGQESRYENKELYIRIGTKVVGDYRINLTVYQPDAAKLAKIAEIAKKNQEKLNSGE